MTPSHYPLTDTEYSTFALNCTTKNNKTLQDSQICDGVVDCQAEKDSNQLDEKFELCFKKVCEGENFFRCTYGGCLNGTLKCDGKIDCWDGSDENKFLCLEDANLLNEYEDLKGDCVDEELFDCKGSCLNWSQVCDGQADCKDGSDEDGTLCAAFECPPPSFRCLYGACVSPNALCNHIPDCVDGSDEMAEICLTEKPGHSVDNQIATWKVRHCKLDDPSKSLVVENYVGGTTFQRNANVPDKTVVHLSCLNGHGLIGQEKNICDGDKWRYPLAKCVPQCKHTGSIIHTSQCILDGHLIDCDQPELPMGTQMVVRCSSDYKQTGDDGLQFCHGNGSWRGHKPEFTVVCKATILSPYVVITNNLCFQKVSIKSVASTEPVLYTVAEGGRYNNTFRPHEPHPYKLHNVSYIHILQLKSNFQTKFPCSVSDGMLEGSLSLIHLIQPLEFGVKLRPVCLTEDVTSDWVTKGDFNGTYIGDATIDDSRISGRYELKEVIGNAYEKYHISAFMKAIQNDIAETQAKGNI
ncbi:LOW QUALITY PROTEIN: modular serine protease [Drosophila eugracilis]|uniref:LOW QUALITY PROTEIN: modular serine protease n=1 Tax=Drosophila eugracilis TaxID=29029 RepID=UPI001BD9CF8F|nr:LOW QUALITY PROTEIN: modular serine protease [Drosophila eugracilis]